MRFCVERFDNGQKKEQNFFNDMMDARAYIAVEMSKIENAGGYGRFFDGYTGFIHTADNLRVCFNID